MLKTRLAEKDAQLMGGFGALSNMQLGPAQGWLGPLPDADSIAASLPDQARPHIHARPHPYPSSPKKAAWGVKRKGGLSSSGHISSTRGSAVMPQQLPSISQSVDAHLTALVSSRVSPAASRRQSDGQQGRQSFDSTDSQKAGLNAALSGSLQGAQDTLQKPNQARPVLLPLSASQNRSQRSSATPLSSASSRSSLQPDQVAPLKASQAASAELSKLGAQFTDGGLPSVAAQGAVESELESATDSEYSETESEASGDARWPNEQLSRARPADVSTSTNQLPPLQQQSSKVSSSSLTPPSSTKAASKLAPVMSTSAQDQSRQIDAKDTTTKKWRVW